MNNMDFSEVSITKVLLLFLFDLHIFLIYSRIAIDIPVIIFLPKLSNLYNPTYISYQYYLTVFTAVVSFCLHVSINHSLLIHLLY